MTDALDELQRNFLGTFPGRLEDLRAQYQNVDLTDWRPVEAQALHHQVHSLTGSAGIFGLQSVSVAARQLERHLKAIVERGTAPDAEAWAAIGAELGRLEQLASSRLDAGGPSLTLPQARPRLDRAPRVFLVEDDREQAEHLSEPLREDGYQVRVFTALDDFRAALGKDEAPDAILLDMVFPEGGTAGADLLTEIQEGREGGLPVVFVSVRDDLDARLAAYVVPLTGKIQSRIEMLEKDAAAASSTAARNKLHKEVEKLRKKYVELLAYDKKLRHYADLRISLDLDDGAKVNYGKFGDLLAEVKAVTGEKAGG